MPRPKGGCRAAVLGLPGSRSSPCPPATLACTCLSLPQIQRRLWTEWHKLETAPEGSMRNRGFK